MAHSVYFIFLRDNEVHKTSRGPGKTSSFSPCRRAYRDKSSRTVILLRRS